MVRSRKYALITAALALILIAAVVLTVALVGDYSSIVPQQEASVAPADVTIGGSTGSVSADYVFQTLKAHSNKKGDGVGWDITEMQTDGSINYYPATLDNTFYLITQSGSSSEANNSDAGVTAKDSYYQVTYNGMNYRFTKNSGYTLYLAFETFITKTNYSQNVNNYGMAVQASASGTISYDPRNTYHSYDFRATFDGAGVTLSMSNMLSKWDSGSTSAKYTWIQNGYRSDDPTIKNNVGLNCAGLLIASLYDGTLKNFKLTDKNAVYEPDANNPDQGSGRPFNCHQSVRTLSGHYYEENNRETGTAFGGLVGYAGPTSANQEANTNSYISNISLDFTKNVLHVYRSTSTEGPAAQVDMFTGAAIGLNMSANISNLVINMNSSVWDQCTVRMQGQGWGWNSSGYSGTAHIGVLSGMMLGGKTLEKVAIYGTDKSAFVCSDDLFQYNGLGNWSKVHTYIGGAIGTCMSNQTINGFLFSYPLANCWYPQADKRTDGATFKRGIFVGNPKGTITYSNVYLTKMVIANSTATSMDAIGGGDYTNYPAAAIVNSHDQVESGPSASFSTGFWFDGNSATNKRFVYADEDVISSIQFSNDSQYMVEISAPSSQTGVMWQVNYYRKGTTTDIGVSNSSQLVFMQNARENVKLRGLGVQDDNDYVVMNITYASSYNFELANGHNNTGSNNKIYNGERVNYATLDLTAQSSATVITTNYQPTYVQIGLNGNVTFHNNSGGTLTNMTNFLTSGSEQNSNFANLASRLFQLEFATDVDEGLFNVAENWDAQVDVNTYRWSSLGLFGVETGNGRFVFAPNTGTQAEVQITQRPISLNLLNPNAPYIGEAYSLAYNPEGGDYASVIDGKVHYNFTSSVNDGKGGLIGTDVVSFIPSGGSFTARDAGNYVLNGTLSGADSGNYQYSVGEERFTIEPAQAVITINGGSMVYGTRPTQAELAGLVKYSVSFKNTGTYLSSGFAAADGITPSFNMQTSLDTATSAGWMFAKAGASVFNNNFPADEYDVVVDALTGTGVKNYVVSEVVVGTQFSVTPRPLTSTLPAVNGFIYGDAVAPTVGTPVFAGWASGDSLNSSEIKYYLSETSAEYTYDVRFGAGTYYVRAVPTAVNAPGSVNGLNNYKVNYNDPLFEVEKRDTYVDFPYDPSLTYTYKAEPYDFKALALSNGASGDTVDDVLFAAYSDPERKKPAVALNAGTYYPGATSAALSANYNILGVRDKNGNEWATFVIGRATVSLSLDKLTLVYNGAEREFALENVTISSDVESLQEELDGLKENLVFLYNNSSVKPQDAATYNVTVNLPQQLNYNAATASLTDGLVIEQLGIVINASDKTVTYNGAVIPEIDFTVAAVDGADVSSLPEGWADKLAISVAYEKDGSPVTSLRNVGTYSVTYTYDGTTGNFKSASKTITYKVDPKPLDFVLNNKNVTYNKQAYVPDYDLTGAVIGDTVNAVLSASENGVPVETIVDAGTYDITVSLVDGTGAPAGNYTVAADGLQVVVAPYEIFAREINTTLFFNSVDADGKDITGSVTVTPDLIGLDNDEPVETIADRGGAYRASLTLELPAGYNPDNYSVQKNVYNVYIYRIALRAVLSQESVTFGDEYNVKGQLYAMAGDAEQPFTVGADGVVAGFNEQILSDVTGLTVTSASMTISGSDLGGNAVDGTLSEVIDAIFNSGIYDAAKMANVGTYSVTVTVKVNAVYTESTPSREVTISAPFTWTVDPYEIKVTPGQLDTYYTEAIGRRRCYGRGRLRGRGRAV